MSLYTTVSKEKNIVKVTTVGDITRESVNYVVAEVKVHLDVIRKVGDHPMILLNATKLGKIHNDGRLALIKALGLKFEKMAVFGSEKGSGMLIGQIISAASPKRVQQFKTEAKAIEWLNTGKLGKLSARNNRRLRQLSAISLVAIFVPLVIVWRSYAYKLATCLPKNFSYSSKVYSLDNLYNQSEHKFNGKSVSNSNFGYNTAGHDGQNLNIKNYFNATSADNQKLIDINRDYHIDACSGQHIGANETSYLFGPRNSKSDFVYWHANYDTPLTMHFANEERLSGLSVYRFTSDFKTDQTKDLSGLPDVGVTKGINLDGHIETWIDPLSGLMISYKDSAEAYYYDLKSGQRLTPWNHFENQVASSSINDHANQARRIAIQLSEYRIILPISFTFLLILIILWQLFGGRFMLRVSPAVVFVIIVGITRIAGAITIADHTQQSTVVLDERLERVRGQLQQKMQIYDTALTGERALIESRLGGITRRQWDDYTQTLDIENEMPGVKANSFIQKVSNTQLKSYLDKRKTEGFTNSSINPAGNREAYYLVTYRSSENSSDPDLAYGFDLYLSPVRKAAMDLARDTNEAVLTSPIGDDLDKSKIAFDIFEPVYSRVITDDDSQDAKRQLLIGFVYFEFEASEYLKSALAQIGENMPVAYYDQLVADKNLLGSTITDHYKGIELVEKVAEMPYGVWKIVAPRSADFGLSAFAKTEPRIIRWAGLFMAITLSGSLFLIIRSRNVAIKQTLSVTKDLRQNEELFRLMIKNIKSYGVYLLDKDGRVETWNEGAQIMTGFKPEDVIGKPTSIFFPKNAKSKLTSESLIRDAVAKGVSHYEGIQIRADGSEYWADAVVDAIRDEHGQLIGFTKVVQDLTNQKAASTKLTNEKSYVESQVVFRTKELRQAQAELMSAIGALPFGFALIGIDNSISFSNDILADMTGLPHPSSEDRKTNSALDKLIDKFKGLVDISEALKSTTTNRVVVTKEVLLGNSYLRFLFAPILIKEESVMQAIGTVLVVEDITEERSLQRSRDEFFSIASHELRTPLTAIKGNVSMMLNYYDKQLQDPELKEMLSDVHESSTRLIEIVNDFLDVSRIEQGKLTLKVEDFYIQEIIKSVVDEISTLVKEQGLEITYSPTEIEALPKVRADKNRTKQVIYNLVGNAVKFTEHGKIKIVVSHDRNFAKIWVSDTGRGIPLETQGLLFHKFQQAGTNILTRDATRGTGLGLYISKLITEKMGGAIRLEQSSENHGSIFSITLPLADPATSGFPEATKERSGVRPSSSKLDLPKELKD